MRLNTNIYIYITLFLAIFIHDLMYLKYDTPMGRRDLAKIKYILFRNDKCLQPRTSVITRHVALAGKKQTSH